METGLVGYRTALETITLSYDFSHILSLAKMTDCVIHLCSISLWASKTIMLMMMMMMMTIIMNRSQCQYCQTPHRQNVIQNAKQRRAELLSERSRSNLFIKQQQRRRRRKRQRGRLTDASVSSPPVTILPRSERRHVTWSRVYVTTRAPRQHTAASTRQDKAPCQNCLWDSTAAKTKP